MSLRYKSIMIFAIAAVTNLSGCLRFDQSLLQPVPTEEYLLLDNRIPDGQLREINIEQPDADLVALWAHHNEVRPSVLFCHGLVGNLDFTWRKVMNIWEAGYNVLAVEFRGYGKSTGEATEEGFYSDVGVALTRLTELEEGNPEDIIIWGHSYGTGIATFAALSTPQRALVLEAPFTSLPALVERASPYSVDGSWVVPAQMPNLARMEELDMPVVVVHGQADVVIPFWMGERIFEAAPEPKRFIAVEDGRHDNLVKKAMDEIVTALDDVRGL